MKIEKVMAVNCEHSLGRTGKNRLNPNSNSLQALYLDSLVVVLLGGIAAILLSPYLFDQAVVMWPRSGFISDLVTYNWTSAFFARRHVAETGAIPLWWDTTMGGLPMVGNLSIRIWYLPMLAAIVLPIPLLQGLSYVNWFSLTIAGVGTYIFLRQTLKISRTSALAGGVMMMLTPRLSANLVGDMGYTAGLCLTPLALLCVRMVFERASFRWALAAGLCLGLMFTLNFVNALYLGLFTVFYAAYILVNMPQRPQRWGRLILLGLIMMLTAIGAAAPTLFPFITYLPYQSRQAFTLTDANYLALPPALLVDALYPNSFKFPEWTFHVGLLPLVLAVVGLRYPSGRDVALFTTMALFALIFALGSVLPLYTLIVSFVPGFGFMRVPPRILIFASFGLVCLAALGIERIRSRGAQLSWRWVLAGVMLGIMSLAIRYLTRRPGELDWLLGLPALGALFGGLAAVVMRARRLGTTLIVCLLMELFPLAASYMGPVPIDTIFATPAYAEPIVRDRQSNSGLFRTYSAPRSLADHILTLNNLQALDGLNSFQFRHFADLVRVATGCPLRGVVAAIPACASAELQADAYRLTQPDPVLLGLLNVRYVIYPDDHPLTGLTEIVVIDSMRVYRNEQQLPRAYFLDADMEAQITRRIAEDTEFAISNVEYTPVMINQAGGGLFELNIEAPAEGLVVVAETWVPGWSALINGQPAPIERVLGALIGVRVGPGAHQVRIVFEPPAFTIGIIVALVLHTAIGALIGLNIIYVKRKRRERLLLAAPTCFHGQRASTGMAATGTGVLLPS